MGRGVRFLAQNDNWVRVSFTNKEIVSKTLLVLPRLYFETLKGILKKN